jgi:hypothetical protein
MRQRRETVHRHAMVDKVIPPKSSNNFMLKLIVLLSELWNGESQKTQSSLASRYRSVILFV